MKLNIIEVLNVIASEEASLELLNDANASWNQLAIDDYRDLYDYEMDCREMANEQTFDLCDWLMSHGESYDHVTFEKIISFNEWKNQFINPYLVVIA